MSIDRLFNITEEDIRETNKRMIEYGKIKRENPAGYELLMEEIRKNLYRLGINITEKEILEGNKKFIEKYKNKK